MANIDEPFSLPTTGSGILDPLLSFVTGDQSNLSLEAIKRRRAVAAALAAQKRGYPKNIGEGIASLGSDIGEMLSERRLDAQEKAYLARENAGIQQATNPTISPAAAPPVAAPPVARQPAVPSPAPPFNPTPGKIGAAAPTLDPTAEGQRNRLVQAELIRKGVNPQLADPSWTPQTAQEVPQPNPTSPEAGAPPVMSGGTGGPVTSTDPVQLAALGGGTMSDAPSPGAARMMPSIPEENPPTPTDIQPMPTRVAGPAAPAGAPAAGVGVIPGAFDPRKAEPPAPPSGLREADPAARSRLVEPPPPVRDDRPSPEEIRAQLLIRQFPGSPRVLQEAQTLAAFGKERRESAYQREVEAYKLKYGAYEKGVESERAYDRERTAKDFELSEKRDTARKAEEDRAQFPLGIDKHHAIVKDSYESVKNIPRAQSTVNNVKALLASDAGMFTGGDANIKTSLAKWAQVVGAPYNPTLTNTETFKGLIVPILAALRPAIVGPGAQSLPELQMLKDAAAGNIKLERRSIENIMNAIEKQGVLDAVNHQRTVIANAGSGPRSETMRQLWSSSFPLPMEKLVPRGAVQLLRNEAAKTGGDPAKLKALKDEFDTDYYTPGLADRVMGQ